jgi:hypothetical protein
MSPPNAATATNDNKDSTAVTELHPVPKARLRSAESSSCPGKITAAEGYAGFAVLRRQSGEPPASLSPRDDQKAFPWYRVVAIVEDDQAASIEIRRENSEVLIIDFEQGFKPSAENLQPCAHDYLEAHYDDRPTELKALRAMVPAGALAGAPVGTPDGVPGDCPIVTSSVL